METSNPPILELEMVARVTGVDQKENKDGTFGDWRVRLQIDGTPSHPPMVLRIPVSVDRARAWGGHAGRRVKIILQSTELS